MDQPKSLTDEQADRVRSALRTLVKEHGSQSAVFRLTGISQQHIGRVTRHTPPPEAPGVSMAVKVAEVMGLSYEQLVNGREPIQEAPVRPELRYLPGWQAAAKEALLRYPRLTEEMVDTIGEIQARRPPARITPEFVMNLAMAWEVGSAAATDETAEAKKEVQVLRRARRRD